MAEDKPNGQVITVVVQRTLYFRCVTSALEPVSGLGGDWSGAATKYIQYRRVRQDGSLIDGTWTTPTNAASGVELGEGWYSLPLEANELEASVVLWTIRDGAAGATFLSQGPLYEMYGGSGNQGGMHFS